MSFFTSFCDFPQKEQHSVWFSRLSTKLTTSGPRTTYFSVNVTLFVPAGRFLDDHLVDQAVFLRFSSTHEVVAVGVLLDAVVRLAGMLLHDFVQLRLQPQDLLGEQLDVARLAAEAPGGLVDHDPRVGQRV